MLLNLTDAEMLEAGLIGLQRTIKSRAQALNKGKHGATANQWEIDVLGSMAERALAKALGIYYTPGINTFHAPDVGDLQVRSTTYVTGRLLIRPGDPQGVYVLVITQPPKFKIAGWFRYAGQDMAQYADAPDVSRPTCWMIQQTALKPIEALHEISTSPARRIEPASAAVLAI